MAPIKFHIPSMVSTFIVTPLPKKKKKKRGKRNATRIVPRQRSVPSRFSHGRPRNTLNMPVFFGRNANVAHGHDPCKLSVYLLYWNRLNIRQLFTFIRHKNSSTIESILALYTYMFTTRGARRIHKEFITSYWNIMCAVTATVSNIFGPVWISAF